MPQCSNRRCLPRHALRHLCFFHTRQIYEQMYVLIRIRTYLD